VHAENFVINDGSQSEVIEDGRAVPPHIGRTVLSEALIVEAVHLGNLSALVVASNQSDSFGVSYLQCQQKQEGLHTVVTSVHEITHKKVVGVWALASNFEEFLEIVELSMDVAANLVRCH